MSKTGTGDARPTWAAYPPNGAHVYHTDREAMARAWATQGLEVEPPVEPYPEGTLGHLMHSP